jgi:hypothetical protein
MNQYNGPLGGRQGMSIVRLLCLIGRYDVLPWKFVGIKKKQAYEQFAKG